MKITTISYEMKRTNGNYGSDAVHLTAELDEGEDPIMGTSGLKILAEYQLNGERREKIAEEQVEVLATPTATDEQKEKAHRYLAKFEVWIAEVETVRSALRQD